MNTTELFDAHYGAVRALALRLTRDDLAADDVAAATFDRLPAALARQRGAVGDIRAFALGVCANVARGVARLTARRRALLEVNAGALSPPASADPEAQMIERELADRVARALRALPAPQRTAFVLVCIEECSTAEAAAACGVPEATIRTRLFHARRRLRRAMLSGRGGGALALAVALLVAVALAGGAYAAGLLRFARARAWFRPAAAGAPAAPRLGPAPGSSAAARPRSGARPLPPPDPGARVAAPRSASAPSPPRARADVPEPGLALYRRAHALHFGARDDARAIAAWDAYLRAQPGGRFALEARYNRALALMRTGQRAEACRALEPFAHGAHGAYRRLEASLLQRARCLP